MSPKITFDGGSAVRLIERSGAPALRRRAPHQKRVSSLAPDQIEQLPDIAVVSFRAVPRHFYYEAAHRLQTQADYLTARMFAIDACRGDSRLSPSQAAEYEKLAKQKGFLCERSIKARSLAHGRRTMLARWGAALFAKHSRETALAAAVIFGVVINAMWAPYLIKVYVAWVNESKKKQPKNQ